MKNGNFNDQWKVKHKYNQYFFILARFWFVIYHRKNAKHLAEKPAYFRKITSFGEFAVHSISHLQQCYQRATSQSHPLATRCQMFDFSFQVPMYIISCCGIIRVVQSRLEDPIRHVTIIIKIYSFQLLFTAKPYRGKNNRFGRRARWVLPPSAVAAETVESNGSWKAISYFQD